MGVQRWTLGEEEIRYASTEAKSVAGVLRNAVRERDARLAATAQTARQSQSQSGAQRRRTATMQTREVFIPPASIRQQEPVAPQQIVVPPAPSPAPARPASVAPQQQQQQHHGRNSSLRLVLQKVAAPFTSSPYSHAHSRKTSTATGASAFSSSSSSSSSSLNSPMPMTPPASSYHSAVDLTSSGYHHHHQQSNYGQAWHGSSLTPPPPPPGLTMTINKRDWLYQQHQIVQPVGGVRR
jgi:hypothetical protein